MIDDTDPTTETPAEESDSKITDTARVRSYQAAARQIVYSKATPAEKRVALARLRERANSEPLKHVIAAAIWYEAECFLETGEIPRAPWIDPAIAGRLALVRQGFACCPRCRLPLPTEEALLAEAELIRRNLSNYENHRMRFDAEEGEGHG